MHYHDVTPSVVFYILKKKQSLKNKIDELTEMIDFGEFSLLSLESPSVVTWMQYVCYLYEEMNQVKVWMNYDIARMFTKKNLSEDYLSLILDALVLHLRRALIFSH